MDGEEKLALRRREAAKALGVSERWLWQRSHPRGDIPCVRVGGAVIYPVTELREWLSREASAAKTEAGPPD
jgi:predicted DNA-binding transcriptional regulator AlpA